MKYIRTIEAVGSEGGKKKGGAANGAEESAAAGGGGGGISEERLAKLETESRGKAAREMAKINLSANPTGQMSFDHISKM